ncbi:DUF2824 family protein [Gluconobacter wancherniae]|uniref:N-acetyltransferase domain-containing protein n=1 Tax=Gluconobacter wancherniae NBRC 103581 TaxID=656744 RepID=A0A511B0P3_9PROT|nr:DUF2824 family protein [Gluconobacter wancherniae]MBF0853333.1 DUF2824 family protein [Gluconobacter wancherniae]GBD55934.1 hypothetical protein NBRC103581_00506 [Gluconobacter wancherniae NBRC 103581]GBR65863.1 hypothetical protein AA103581_2046 [Gluconobacter wancherniae NBRC 103581]GEK93163.1 hypothetical protein GWA01_09330 [Gluconobacter wancherniae NBRC 103581]
MIFAAPSISGAAVNDINAINAVITHPGVYGEEAQIVDVPGIVVGFRAVRERVHECHQAVIPEMRGKQAIAAMRQIRDWWWTTQPSDLMIAAIPDDKKSARFTMHALGFVRWGEIDAPCPDGIVRHHVTYKMERPK